MKTCNLSRKKLVSVIVPIHNRFDIVLETLLSVIYQTYRPIELIIVDDASSHTFMLLDVLPQSDKELTIEQIRSNENIGPGAAREIGRLKAKGEFICYLDSDDLWEQTKIEKQVEMLLSNPQLGMCYCQTSEFQELPITGTEKLRYRNDRSFDSLLPTLFYGRPWSTSSCMWTRSAVDAIGRWLNTWTWEDVEYDFRAGLKNIRICHLPEVLCYKRYSSNVPQLSALPAKDIIIQKYRSVMEMSRQIKSIKVESETKKLFVHKFLRPVLINLLSIEEYESASNICKTMKELSPVISKKWLLSNLIHVLLITRQTFGTQKFILEIVERMA